MVNLANYVISGIHEASNVNGGILLLEGAINFDRVIPSGYGFRGQFFFYTGSECVDRKEIIGLFKEEREGDKLSILEVPEQAALSSGEVDFPFYQVRLDRVEGKPGLIPGKYSGEWMSAPSKIRFQLDASGLYHPLEWNVQLASSQKERGCIEMEIDLAL